MNLCDPCETASHCARNGCVPITDNPAIEAVRLHRIHVPQAFDEPMPRAEEAQRWPVWLLVFGVAVALFAALGITAWPK
jgi:hypothetical protein